MFFNSGPAIINTCPVPAAPGAGKVNPAPPAAFMFMMTRVL